MKAETALAHPDDDGWLGDFHRGPAVFSVFREMVDRHPLVPDEYRITCNDGAGPRVICRFVNEREMVPEWNGAWNNDDWCEWMCVTNEGGWRCS